MLVKESIYVTCLLNQIMNNIMNYKQDAGEPWGTLIVAVTNVVPTMHFIILYIAATANIIVA